MFECNKSGDFSKYFNQNMASLGIPSPTDLFGNYNTALANAIIIIETMKSLGTAATMGMIIGATTGLEKLKTVAALTASFYVGAVIGSIAVASGRLLGCGSSIADVFVFMNQNRLNFENSIVFFKIHPEILDTESRFRRKYYAKALSRSRRMAA